MIGNKKHYVVAGATGLVGKKLIEQLLDHPETGKVTALIRRETGFDHQKLSEKQIDFEEFSEKDFPANTDAVICCLGTTMAIAGGKDAFRRVDFEYVVKLGVFAQRRNIPQYHVVSARGANPKSKIFYNKVKGRMELELKKLGKIKSIYFYRPSLLMGNRKEFRYAESVGRFLFKILAPILPKAVRGIYDRQVAHAIIHHANNPKKGIHIVTNSDMHNLSK